MKTKTRNRIGSVLVWGGIAIIGLVAYFNLYFTAWTGYNLTHSEWDFVGIILLLIGGLWGMKR
jgi:hypothetical protein